MEELFWEYDENSEPIGIRMIIKLNSKSMILLESLCIEYGLTKSEMIEKLINEACEERKK